MTPTNNGHMLINSNKIKGFLLLVFCGTLFLVFDVKDLYSESSLQNTVSNFIESVKKVILVTKDIYEEPIKVAFRKYSDRKCQFITFSYAGRTGNQMFEYAAFYGLAKGNNKTPFIRWEEFPLITAFKLSIPLILNASQIFNFSTFSGVPDTGAYAFDERSFLLNCDLNYSMGGYRASWRWFSNYSDEIKNEFRFMDNIDKECNNVLHNLTEENNVTRSNCTLIGAHMRRGDFVYEGKQNFGHVPATKQYLHRAINFFEKRYRNHSCLLFIVVGEDYSWNLANSPNQSNVIVFKPRTPYIDMCVLSRCNHTIISSGSYGWWSAYLAGGEATYMADQCRVNSSLCQGYDYDAYINPDWKWFPIKT